jgi:hypothetical protein
MRKMAMSEAKVTSVKKELMISMPEQIIWLIIIHVLRFP